MPFRFNPFTGNFDETGGTGGGGSTSPGGSDTGSIQVNDGGVFAGFVDLLWNKVTKLLTVKGDIKLDDSGAYTTTLQCITPTANRTISFPDAPGTVALVGGSSGQAIYNNGGALAGISTMTFDGTSVTLAGRLINSYNSASLAPAKVFTGTWVTGQGTTNTKPHFLIEPTGTSSGAWSPNGTGLGVNAASTFSGNLLDLQVNGTSRFSVDSAASIAYVEYVRKSRSEPSGTISLGNIAVGAFGCGLQVGGVFGIASGGNASTPDTLLGRDASGIFAQRNGTNAQTFRLYNTLTGFNVGATGNYERGFLQWNSNVLEIGTEVGSGGGTVRPVRITAATLKLPNLPTYADNAAATTGGLVAGDVYKTATGELRITV